MVIGQTSLYARQLFLIGQHLPESEIADLESSTAKTSDPLVVLAYDGYSDADEKHRPTGAQWMKCDPEFVERVYLTKIAQKYMEESGQAEVGKLALLLFFPSLLFSPVLTFDRRLGKRYQLDRLPAGYISRRLTLFREWKR